MKRSGKPKTAKANKLKVAPAKAKPISPHHRSCGL